MKQAPKFEGWTIYKKSPSGSVYYSSILKDEDGDSYIVRVSDHELPERGPQSPPRGCFWNEDIRFNEATQQWFDETSLALKKWGYV